MATITRKGSATKATTPKKAAAKTAATTVKATASKKKISHVFPNGTKVTGTIEDLQKVADALGVKLVLTSATRAGYYNSASKGLIKISSMNDHHIRRAILKRASQYMRETYVATDSNADFMKKFAGMSSDAVISQLTKELASR